MMAEVILATAAKEGLNEHVLASLPGPNNVYSYFNSYEGQSIICVNIQKDHRSHRPSPFLFCARAPLRVTQGYSPLPCRDYIPEAGPSSIPKRVEQGCLLTPSSGRLQSLVPPDLSALLLVLRTGWESTAGLALCLPWTGAQLPLTCVLFGAVLRSFCYLREEAGSVAATAGRQAESRLVP